MPWGTSGHFPIDGDSARRLERRLRELPGDHESPGERQAKRDDFWEKDARARALRERNEDLALREEMRRRSGGRSNDCGG